MKNLVLLASLLALSLGSSSCCSMFGLPATGAGFTTETRQVKTCHTDTITEQVWVGGSAKSGGMYQTVEKTVPRYKTVTKKVRVPCGACTRYYCPKKDCCGSTSRATMLMASAQGSSGSPNLGLIPTMKVLPLDTKGTTP
ncbi:MAG: hypothetical protein WED15_06380 [Akkermansiaceae bacterium]